MDGSTIEHSDSDSGESWTLLESHPAYGDDAPDFPEKSSAYERNHTEANIEKDEDTDGISIISDSDPESAPCDITCHKCSTSENYPLLPQEIEFLNNPQTPNNKKTFESLCNEDDFMEGGSLKPKTYVHKRNKRLSMVLNIIVLGSVITAAGVAIGHMWGATNECPVPVPSVNKILSNMYKLQEENAYLRNKLKELTLAGNIQVQQMKSDSEKRTMKQHRCKKVFEEPLENYNARTSFKCVDHNSKYENRLNDQLPKHEKEFLDDIEKLKNVYNQNKSWLDEHIERRLNNERNIRNNRNIKLNQTNEDHTLEKVRLAAKLTSVEEHDEKTNVPKLELKEQVSYLKGRKEETKNKKPNPKKSENAKETKKSHKFLKLEKQLNLNEQIGSSHHKIITQKTPNIKTKISYADSLKTEFDGKQKKDNNDSNDLPIRGMRSYGHKKKLGDDDIAFNAKSLSDDEIPTDDRYTGTKIKRDKNKHDRHKIHKKQKRRNKYEQWEMKGGYLKDFDEFSMTSSQANLGVNVRPEKRFLNQDLEHYLSTIEDNQKEAKKSNDKLDIRKDAWFDKRHNIRAEARRKLERELFGEISPNYASWYFRRMNKREQCRAQKDNSTFKKFTKEKLNFKMKH